MNNNDNSTIEHHRIFAYMAKASWLHIEDALEIGKIRLFAGRYSRGQGAQEYLVHWIDVDDARVLLSDMSWGKRIDFTDYKGTAKGEVISRVLRVNTGKDDRVYFELSTGPGRATETGAVTPAGEATARINVGLATWQARKLAHAVLEYIQAYAISQMTIQPIRQVPIQQVPIEQVTAAAEYSLSDINQDLFGDQDIQPHVDGDIEVTGQDEAESEPTPTNGDSTQYMNGLTFANGDPVPVSLRNEYQQFAEIMNCPPFNAERLTSWIYRN